MSADYGGHRVGFLARCAGEVKLARVLTSVGCRGMLPRKRARIPGHIAKALYRDAAPGAPREIIVLYWPQGLADWDGCEWAKHTMRLLERHGISSQTWSF